MSNSDCDGSEARIAMLVIRMANHAEEVSFLWGSKPTGMRNVFKTKSSIVSLIKSKGLRVKDVESIVPPKSEADISNSQAYRFVLRSDLELQRDVRLGEHQSRG
jgi:hypothetical protein